MMTSISMVEAKLPPGFRFHPRDDELVCDYLMRKAAANNIPNEPPAPVAAAADDNNDTSLLMIEVDLNKCEPWDIPETACIGGKEWYFYSQRDRKYATGLRTNRATASGYWKATGKDRPVLRKRALVGMRKTLVFYQGRAPKGRKSDWVMHEFRIEAGPLGPPKISSHKDDWVLCRVFFKDRGEAARSMLPSKSCFGSSSLDDDKDDWRSTMMISSSSLLPPLMDDSTYIHLDPSTRQQQQQPLDNFYYDQEHVSCFSKLNNIFSLQSQLMPDCRPIIFLHGELEYLFNNQMPVPVHVTLPTRRTGNTDDIAVASASVAVGSSSSSPSAALLKADLGRPSSCCDGFDGNYYMNPTSDKKVLKAVLEQLAKIEAAADRDNGNNDVQKS